MIYEPTTQEGGSALNILITGGLGVNGVWVTRKLLARGLRPIIFENRPDLSLVSDIADQFEVVRGDINDVAGLTRVLLDHHVQRVVHMAALMPPDAQRDPLNGFRVNAFGTVQVLEAARIAGVERVVFTSSRAAYGEIPPGPHSHPTYEPVTEDYACHPVIVYDVCKVASEGMGLNYQRNFGLQFVALRFGAIYGPGKLARHGNVSIHSKLIENAMASQPVRILKGGDQRDDMIYVDDIAEGVVLATLKDKPAHSIYNIASGEAHTLEEFAAAVRAEIPGADIEIGPGLDFFDMGVNYYCRFDIARARQDLGFEPRFPFRAGVRDYVRTMERLQLQPVASV
ncbi:MAG: NAD-dependent epimerase/dehydratase family protein [Chloroflexi bacterium]|nr:NAD-dependent epimerase/dehydratase family protein [Chloroflexota bacterium]